MNIHELIDNATPEQLARVLAIFKDKSTPIYNLKVGKYENMKLHGMIKNRNMSNYTFNGCDLSDVILNGCTLPVMNDCKQPKMFECKEAVDKGVPFYQLRKGVHQGIKVYGKVRNRNLIGWMFIDCDLSDLEFENCKIPNMKNCKMPKVERL